MVEVGGGGVEDGTEEVGGTDEPDEEGDEGAVPPDLGAGPAIDVVIGASSTKIPDQYQSSGAAFVPPLGRRRTPMCQSSELVDGLHEMGSIIWVRGLDPFEAQRPHVPPLKSMSYAKLYQFPAARVVLH